MSTTTSTEATTVLAPEDHEHFLKEGYVLVRNAVPPAVIAEAVRQLEPGSDPGEPSAVGKPPDRGDVVQACVTDTVHNAVAELFGDDYPYSRHGPVADMPRVHTPDLDGPTWIASHVDDDYPTIMPSGWALGMFLFLTPVRPRGGGFVFYAGSPNRIRPIAETDIDEVVGATSWRVVTGKGQEYLAQPGDLLLFHHMMIHTGTVNVSDASTRHALLTRFHPHARIVPGDKPFDEMSTIEKANSARYLRERHADAAAWPPLASVAQHAGDGLAAGRRFGGRMAAYTVCRRHGRTQVLYADMDRGPILRMAETDDWAHWRETEALDVREGLIRNVAIHTHGATVMALDVEHGDDRETRLFWRTPADTWAEIARLPGTTQALPYHCTQHGSGTAIGQLLLYVPAAAPGEIHTRWGGAQGSGWHGVANWSDQAVVLRAPEGRRVASIGLWPVLGEGLFALVMDLADKRGGTQSYVAHSQDCVKFDDEPRPLAHELPSPPHHVRAYLRARHYWLVTFVREVDGEDRLFWGEIDWDVEPWGLQELATPDELQRALGVVGLR